MGAAVRGGGPRPFRYRLALVEPPAACAATPASVRELTQRVASVIAEWVLEDPLQWRWVHWRWKTRPDGTEETYTRRDLRACFAPAPADDAARRPGSAAPEKGVIAREGA